MSCRPWPFGGKLPTGATPYFHAAPVAGRQPFRRAWAVASFQDTRSTGASGRALPPGRRSVPEGPACAAARIPVHAPVAHDASAKATHAPVCLGRVLAMLRNMACTPRDDAWHFLSFGGQSAK